MANIDHQLVVKIRDGTRPDGKRLCDTCQSGHIRKGSAIGQEYIYCNSIDQPVTFKVVECSDYRNKADVPLHTMQEVAWILRTSRAGRAIGFVSAEEWRKKNGRERD